MMTHGIPPERLRIYAIKALTASPKVLATLLHDITEAEADRRPDPERFTLREAVAHLADWEPIWLGRLRAIAEEENSALPGYDEEQFAIDHDYVHTDILERAMRYADGRALLAEYVEAAKPEVWARSGVHGEMGPITFAELVMLVLAHDGYHAKQVVEFRHEM